MNHASLRPVRDFVTTVRRELRERREARAAYRALEQELASYRTPREVDDLLGTMNDQDSPEAQQIRDILLDNLRPTTEMYRVS
jgi:hypothetical protein